MLYSILISLDDCHVPMICEHAVALAPKRIPASAVSNFMVTPNDQAKGRRHAVPANEVSDLSVLLGINYLARELRIFTFHFSKAFF